MQEQAIKITNEIDIKHQLRDLPFFQNDMESYRVLLLSIADIWMEEVNSKGKKRTKLWMQFLSHINNFIFNSDKNEIDFYRCLTSGALIFLINPHKTMIFLKLSYLQNLFQMISPSPSKSTILKRCGKKSVLKPTEIPLILEFQSFMKNICQKSDCLYDWSLYEFSVDSTDFMFDCFKPLYTENAYNNKIIDFIIDDDQDGLSKLFASFDHKNTNLNQRFTMANFKLPDLISDCPPYSSLCVFFSAEKCFSFICSSFQDGLKSKQMRQKDYKGRTLFHFACYNGCMDIIEKMVEMNLDINDFDDNGFSACHYAAMSGNIQVLSFLLENGYDVFANHYPSYMTPYDVACFYDNISFLKLIDQKVKNDIGINFTNLNCKHTPLCLACQGNNEDVVEYILHKIDFGRQKVFGDIIVYSPFIYCFKYNAIECFKSLINNKFDKLLSLEKQKMLLIDAAEFGNVNIVTILMKKGYYDDSTCFKALKSAINNIHYDVIQYLINNNAANAQDEESIAELFLSSFVSMQLVVLIDQSIKIPYNSKGKIFLQRACVKEDKELVLFLLNKKCEFDFSIIQNNENPNSEFMLFLQKVLPFFVDRALLKSDGKEVSSENDHVSTDNMQSSFSFSNKDDGLNDEKMNSDDKMNPKYSKHQMKEIDQDFFMIFTDNEKKQFESICSHFQKIKKLSINDYYSLIHALSEFCSEKDDCKSIHRCVLSGIIPTFEKIKYEDLKGTIIAINSSQLSKVLQKSHNILQMSFLHQNSIELSLEQVNDLLSKRICLRDKILAYHRILDRLGYHFKFYFIKNNLNELVHFNLDYCNALHSPENNIKKRYPNNIKFIRNWQKIQKLEKENLTLQKQLVKWKSFVKQLQDLVNIVKDIFTNDINLEQNKNLLISNEEINTIDLTDEEAIDYANILFEDIKKIIYLFNENNVEKSKYDLESIVETIYSSNPAQKEIALQIIKDIINHKSHQSWEESNVLKFSFLMKYCSSASYYRLFKFLNQKLPSPSTVDKHFLPKVVEREKILTSSDEILPLLNQYWEDVEPKVEEYLTEFNNRYHTKFDIRNYKINISLGCDAASFTTFACKKKKNENQNKIDGIKAALNSLKQKKNDIFKDLVNGNFQSDGESQRIEIPDDCSGYFFTLLIQPFIWKLPVTVAHLSKSINGHFSVNEAEDIKTLLNIINSHPHFKCRYFAADGETSLDEFHEFAFKKYESELENVIEGKMSFDDFLDFVEKNCFILPILDMLHAEKSGRNRIMNNDVKLGNNADIITKEKLIQELDIHSSVLTDTSSIGRMKDSYPIHLFQVKNAINEFHINNNTSGLYLIIYSILLEIFRNPYIEIQLRFDLTKLLFYLLVLLYRNIKSLPESTGLRKNANSSNQYVWFQDRINLMKLINTVIGVAQVLRNPETSFYIGMERLSSHPEEQFFGNYRNHFNGHYIPKNALRYAVRSSLALDYANDLSIYFRIDKRENYAGAHLNFKNKDKSESDVFTILNHFQIHNNIIEIAFELFHIGTGEITDFSPLTSDFLQSLALFFEKYKSFRNSTFSTSKGVGIIPRIVANVPNSKNEDSIKTLNPSNDPISEFGEFESNLNS